EHVHPAREPPDECPHAIVDRILPAPQCESFLEHQEKDDADARGRDKGQNRLGGQIHAWPSPGEVRPLAGPQRKCPRRTPMTMEMANAHTGCSCTAGRT